MQRITEARIRTWVTAAITQCPNHLMIKASHPMKMKKKKKKKAKFNIK